jgi:hypothetical protein
MLATGGSAVELFLLADVKAKPVCTRLNTKVSTNTIV